MKKILSVVIVIGVIGCAVWVISIADTTPGTTPSGQSGTFTLAQVAKHNRRESCYSAIRGMVYDLTDWISQHPGGENAIMSICGTDGTNTFLQQHGGSQKQEDILKTFVIGTLAQ